MNQELHPSTALNTHAPADRIIHHASMRAQLLTTSNAIFLRVILAQNNSNFLKWSSVKQRRPFFSYFKASFSTRKPTSIAVNFHAGEKMYTSAYNLYGLSCRKIKHFCNILSSKCIMLILFFYFASNVG